MVEAHTGQRPPELREGIRDKATSGVKSSWLRENFNNCPEGARAVLVERYARVWLWHLMGDMLFPDGTGNIVSWLVLPILGESWESIDTYSWGSATLAWLYRQLCEACRCSDNDANLGGCGYLLQIWMWERFPVGRPDRGRMQVSTCSHFTFPILALIIEFGLMRVCLQHWPYNDEGSLPTVGWIWKDVGAVRVPPKRRYLSYTNEFDVLQEDQVNIIRTHDNMFEILLNRSNRYM